MKSRKPWMVVSVHDVAPATWEICRQQLADVEALGVRASLLVIPGPWRQPAMTEEPRFGDWLRACSLRGHEISQHGWDHRATGTGSLARRAVGAVVARGSAEFWTLDQSEATRRLTLGRASLQTEGFDPAGFTAPGWLASPGTTAALASLGYHYMTTHWGVVDLRSGTAQRAVALCHRAGRRGEWSGAAVLQGSVRLLVSLGAPIRVAMHPADLYGPGLHDRTLGAIGHALARGAVPHTYLEVATAATATT